MTAIPDWLEPDYTLEMPPRSDVDAVDLLMADFEDSCRRAREQEERTRLRDEREQRRQQQQTQFNDVFPRVMEMVCAGSTLREALAFFQPLYAAPLDHGRFVAWVNNNSERKAVYTDAKEIRAEAWVSRIVELAEGKDELVTLDRAKVAIETYKWLISRHARKEYGDTKTIEMSATISVSAALKQATERIIEVEVVEETKRLAAPTDDGDNDE